jgi:hypothetical protein
MNIENSPRPPTANDAAQLESLHPGLREVLDRELHAGNEIREIASGWPKPMSVLVLLQHTFRTADAPPPTGISYSEVNDPHYWLAEFRHEESGQIVACPFPRSRSPSLARPKEQASGASAGYFRP